LTFIYTPRLPVFVVPQFVALFLSEIFVDFRRDLALFQCPAGQGVKKALQALIG
jgi:hypothetical protein